MSNLNKVLLMGRLTRDPELRYTPQGTPVTEIGLAINREFSTSEGERRKDVVFVDVTLWRRQAEVVCQWLKKGQPIFVEGRLTLDTWETQEGQRRSKMRVVADNFQFVGSRAEREGSSESFGRGGGAGSEYEYQAGGSTEGDGQPGKNRPRAPAGAPASDPASDPSREASTDAGDAESVDEREIPF